MYFYVSSQQTDSKKHRLHKMNGAEGVQQKWRVKRIKNHKYLSCPISYNISYNTPDLAMMIKLREKNKCDE